MGNCSSNNGSTKSSSPPPPNKYVLRAPLMSGEEREAVANIYKKQFSINENFITNTAFTMLRVKQRVNEARERISSRQNSIEEAEIENSSTQKSLTSTFKSSKSFVRYRDQQEDEQKATRETRISSGIQLLNERTENFRIQQVVMKDDGNCQFRAIAHQVTGSQDTHLDVRKQVVAYMQRVRGEQFDFYFETTAEANAYFDAMNENGTWGDELTLRAATDLFNLRLHVLTSDESNYYHKYEAAPEMTSNDTSSVTICGVDTSSPDKKKKDDKEKVSKEELAAVEAFMKERGEGALDVFVAYISPIHYNSVVLKERPPSAQSQKST